MSDPSPLVSIVIPNKNRRDLVQETLRSLVAQTYPHWEALVIDDASTDGATQAIQETFGTDARIRVLARTGPVGGAQVARNQGTRASCGKYVIYLDNDDLLAPGCLEQRVQVMEQNPELDFAVFPTRFFSVIPGDSNRIIPVHSDTPLLIRFLNRLDQVWYTTGPIWTRHALKVIGEWDETLIAWQDYDYSLRSVISNLTYRVFFDAPYDSYYRSSTMYTDTISSRYFSEAHFAGRIRIYRKLLEHLRKSHQLTPEIQKMLANAILHFARELVLFLGQRETAYALWRFCFQEHLISISEFLEGSFGLLYLEDRIALAEPFDKYVHQKWPIAGQYRQQKYPVRPNPARFRPSIVNSVDAAIAFKEKGEMGSALQNLLSALAQEPDILFYKDYTRLLLSTLFFKRRRLNTP